MRSKSRKRSQSPDQSRGRRRSFSSSSSSSSHSDDSAQESERKDFNELLNARRRKELEELLCLPTKSILKKRNDLDDSPSLRVSC